MVCEGGREAAVSAVLDAIRVDVDAAWPEAEDTLLADEPAAPVGTLEFLMRLDVLTPGRLEKACRHKDVRVDPVLLTTRPSRADVLGGKPSGEAGWRAMVAMSEVYLWDLHTAAGGKEKFRQLPQDQMDAVHASLIAVDHSSRLGRISLLDRGGRQGKGFSGLCERVHVVLAHRERVMGRLMEPVAKASPPEPDEVIGLMTKHGRWVDDAESVTDMPESGTDGSDAENESRWEVWPDEDPIKNELCDAEFLCSRFVDRVPPEGLVVRCFSGMWVVEKRMKACGAELVVMAPLGGAHRPRLVVCRSVTGMGPSRDGTRSRFAGDIAFPFVVELWPLLSQHLEELGEAMTPQQAAVHLMGKGMGGALAQQLAVMAEGIHGPGTVQCLTTVASPGCGPAANHILRNHVLRGRRSRCFPIRVVRKAGNGWAGTVDYVPLCGGVHLGTGLRPSQVDIDVFYTQPADEAAAAPPPVTGAAAKYVVGGTAYGGQADSICGVPTDGKWSRVLGLRRLFMGTNRPHHRQVSLYGDFCYRHLGAGNEHEIQKELAISSTLEAHRKLAGWAVFITTAGRMGWGRSGFSEYFLYRRRMMARQEHSGHRTTTWSMDEGDDDASSDEESDEETSQDSE